MLATGWEIQEAAAPLAAAKRGAESLDFLDAWLHRIERSVKKIEQGFTAEKFYTGAVAPNHPQAFRVPQPGRMGRASKILKGWHGLVQASGPALTMRFGFGGTNYSTLSQPVHLLLATWLTPARHFIGNQECCSAKTCCNAQ
jgi:hypothetical protein